MTYIIGNSTIFWKIKMAAAVQGLCLFFHVDNIYISASIAQSNTIVTVRPFSESSKSMAVSSIVPNIKGVQKFNMTADKLEVLISELADEIETRSEELYNSHFWGYIN